MNSTVIELDLTLRSLAVTLPDLLRHKSIQEWKIKQQNTRLMLDAVTTFANRKLDHPRYIEAGCSALNDMMSLVSGNSPNRLVKHFYNGFTTCLKNNVDMHNDLPTLHGVPIKDQVIIASILDVAEHVRRECVFLPEYVQRLVMQRYPRLVCEVHSQLDSGFMAKEFPQQWGMWNSIFLVYAGEKAVQQSKFNEWLTAFEQQDGGMVPVPVSLKCIVFDIPNP